MAASFGFELPESVMTKVHKVAMEPNADLLQINKQRHVNLQKHHLVYVFFLGIFYNCSNQ